MARDVDWRWIARGASLSIAGLIGSTLAAYALEHGLGFEDASTVYLLAVAMVAIAHGTAAAVGTSIGAFLVYNVLFVEPRYTFLVTHPPELLTLVLLLVIGILIGRLAGLQRAREHQAALREREARALYSASSALNVADDLASAGRSVLDGLAAEAQMERMWIGVAADGGQERTLADTAEGVAIPAITIHSVLRPASGESGPSWQRLLPPSPRAAEPAAGVIACRVELRTGDGTYGSLWGLRRRSLGLPGAEESRLLAAAADQVAQAIRRQALVSATAELEITRRSDELKSALLDSVSHDLRTPLATIRAAAGTLADVEVGVDDAERARLGAAIDVEADRLDRLVGNLLDMSRIEGGQLRPDLQIVPVRETTESVVERLDRLLHGRHVAIEVSDRDAVWADPLMLDQIFTNLIENAARHAPPGGHIRISAATSPATGVTLTIDDDGPGVPDATLPRLFDKFFRAPDRREGARHGTGLGLAIVRGLTLAMGGSVSARRGPLGGLAIDLVLPAADAADERKAAVAPSGAGAERA